MDGPIIPAGDGVLHGGSDGAGTSVSDIMTRGMRGAGDLHGVGPRVASRLGARLDVGAFLVSFLRPLCRLYSTWQPPVSEREAAGLHRRVPVEIMEGHRVSGDRYGLPGLPDIVRFFKRQQKAIQHIDLRQQFTAGFRQS